MNRGYTTSFKSVLVFFELLKKVNQKDLQYIKQLYVQSAERFEDCIDFLLSINLVNLNSGYIEPTPPLNKFLLKRLDENKAKEFLINKLLTKRSIDLWEYLEKFSFSHDKYIFEPQISENLKFSSLRNLLIELEFIFYNPNEKNYEITEKYIPLFVDVIQEHAISPEKLKKIIEEQDKIGKCAELEIMNYEKSRLSNRQDLLLAIEHKSLKDTSVGYDIKSFTLSDGLEVTDRFIEVKAISKSRKKFYMTRNEVNTSKKYGLEYYLYLLPVVGRTEFDLANLMIIQNPYDNIFNNNEWEIECEQFIIKKEVDE
ncbi:MAG: DUF3883 domain-containing protein [Ignavibacteriales bacterium]|nr:DUF3883 domain-containing protein [Ignavibacteriales bacterium]